MTDTATTPAPAAPRQRAAPRPQVSVRPVAVGALNAAVIGGATIVTAGGGLVLAAAGAGLAGVAAASASRKAGKARAAKQERTIAFGRNATSGSVSPSRAGRSSAASPGRSSGSRAGAGGRAAGASPGSKSGGSLVPKGRAGRGSGSTGGGRSLNPFGKSSGSGRPGAAGHRRAGSAPGSGGSRSPLTARKVAAARRKLQNRRQPGPRMSEAIRNATTPTPTGGKPTARQAFRDARRALTGNTPKRRGPLRRATAGLLAGGIAAGKAAYDARLRRKKRDAARQAKNDRINTRQQKPGVRDIIRQSGGQTNQPNPTTNTTDTPVAKPAPIDPAPGTTKPAPATSGGPAMSRQLLALSEDFLAAAQRNAPEGMLQVAADAHMLPQIMNNFAHAMDVHYAQAQCQPLHPAIKDMYAAVRTAQWSVVGASEEIGPNIERIHEEELNRLRNPNLRGDESMWDVTKNRGAV